MAARRVILLTVGHTGLVRSMSVTSLLFIIVALTVACSSRPSLDRRLAAIEHDLDVVAVPPGAIATKVSRRPCADSTPPEVERFYSGVSLDAAVRFLRPRLQSAGWEEAPETPDGPLAMMKTIDGWRAHLLLDQADEVRLNVQAGDPEEGC